MAIDVKTILAHALVSLCEYRSLEKITVTELLHETGVGRRTFYVHFADKNDLIRWIYEEKVINVCVNEDPGTCVLETELYYSLLLKNKKFFEQACKMEGQNCLTDSMYELTEKRLRLRAERFGYSNMQAVHFYSRAMTLWSIEWIRNGMRTGPAEAAEGLKKARTSSLDELFGPGK